MKNTIHRLGLILAASLAFAFAVPTTHATPIAVFDITNDTGQSAPYSLTWAQNLTLGYDFTVAGAFSFNAIALFDYGSNGLNYSHEVRVWSGNSVVASAFVDPTDPAFASTNSSGQWIYQSLYQTITLTAGTYTIGAYYNFASQTAATRDRVMVRQVVSDNVPGVSYYESRYIYATGIAKPTFGPYTSNDEQYFGPTLVQVPEPTTLAILGLGLLGLGFNRRKN